jgi:hypothetical protein
VRRGPYRRRSAFGKTAAQRKEESKMIFGALLQNWKLITLALLIATAVIYRAVLVHQRDSARAQATQLSTEAAVLRADNAAMKSSVGRQNAAIGALQQEMRVAQLEATQREAKYAASATEAMNQELARASAIRKAPVPAGCQGAIEWGNAQGPELGRW